MSPTSPQFLNHLRITLSLLGEEHLHVWFLDVNRQLLASDCLTESKIKTVDWCFRDLAQRVIETQARAIIFAHNHPSGTHHPSKLDIVTTNRVADFLAHLDAEFVDHLVVGRCGITSLRKAGLM